MRLNAWYAPPSGVMHGCWLFSLACKRFDPFLAAAAVAAVVAAVVATAAATEHQDQEQEHDIAIASAETHVVNLLSVGFH